jgi:hypothetical protein
MNIKIPYSWEAADIKWEDNPFKWNDIYYIVKKIIKGGGGEEGYKKLDPEDKKKFIKVVLTIKGVKYDESKTEFKKYEVTAQDIEMVIKEVKVHITPKDKS